MERIARHARTAARSRWHRGVLAGLIVAAGWLGGCAGHADRTAAARTALDHGQPRKALSLLNEELGVDRADQLPESMEGDAALLVLDRAIVLQQLGDYALSARDLRAADKQIELLDFSRGTGDELGKYLFSDDTGPYRAPAYEKLMINTMNLANYLVLGDLNGARVEARRLAVMQRYLAEHEDEGKSLLGPGSYLAGFVFEKSGRPQEALRYYDEALAYGDYRSLHEVVVRLSREATYRSPRIRKILAEHADGSPEQGPKEPAPEPPVGEILVMVSYGRVPAKYAERVPIGLALTYASGFMSPHNAAQANALAAQGLVTWVNYPELGAPRGEYDIPQVAIDGRWQGVEGALAVDQLAVQSWKEARGAIMAAAITRMITRVIAGEAVRQGSGGGTVGLLLSLGTQATMTAADTPDTRSWSTLPARIAFVRAAVPPGQHWVDVRVRGVASRQRVEVGALGWAVVNLTELR